MLQLTTIGIEEVELHATDLCTGATIGRTTKAMLRGIALTTIADAEGSMNKDFQLDIRNLRVYLRNLLDRQLTSQHYPLETKTCQPLDFLYGAVVSLGTGVQLGDSPPVIRYTTHMGTVPVPQHLQHGHILHEDGIDTSSREFVEQLTGGLQFVVIDDGVDSNIHLGSELMGILAELTDVVNTIACCHTGTKLLGTNIDSISAMINGRDAALQILGRCQQFEFCKR